MIPEGQETEYSLDFSKNNCTAVLQSHKVDQSFELAYSKQHFSDPQLLFQTCFYPVSAELAGR